MTTDQAARAILPDRCHDKYAWMYTRKSMEPLDMNDRSIKIDKEKGKMLKRLLRK